MNKLILALGSLTLTLGLLGCSRPSGIPVNADQTLVMETSVLAAGIRAADPQLERGEGQISANASLYNEQSQPVTLYYRFYWYNAKGLEIQPTEPQRSLVIPPQSGSLLSAVAPNLNVHKVRLYLSVRSQTQ